VTTTSELLLRWDRQRARSKQVELGISEIGGCRRRAGYRLHQVEPSNAGGSVQAAMGSAIHGVVAGAMSEVAEPGDLVEHGVTFAGLKGTLDRYEAATQTVVDLKTTSARWMEHLKIHGPDENQRYQVNSYGAALIKQGKPVRRVRIEFLARDTGEEWTWEGPFDTQAVRDALTWLKNVRETPLEMLPRDYSPESPFCHSCRFADICWPYGLEGREARKVLYVEDPDAQKWADQLWEARETRKAAEKREAEAKGALEALRPMVGHGLVDAGTRRLSFRTNGIYFTARDDGHLPGVGYHEEAS
jgi:CRISPR/Cas system-associated exonuclease Cas4 (RecB family)